MKCVIVSGSHRKEAESLRVSHYFEKRISELLPGSDAEVISLSENPLPLWDEGLFSGDPKWKEIWGPISQKLEAADAAILVTPEWHGMATSGMKNFLLVLGKELAHKPALIASVSGGQGGAYPVSELRMSGYKNSRICFIPEHIILRHVKDMLQENGPSGDHAKDDKYIRERIDFTIKLLDQYAQALTPVRSGGLIDHQKYPNGL